MIGLYIIKFLFQFLFLPLIIILLSSLKSYSIHSLNLISSIKFYISTINLNSMSHNGRSTTSFSIDYSLYPPIITHHPINPIHIYLPTIPSHSPLSHPKTIPSFYSQIPLLIIHNNFLYYFCLHSIIINNIHHQM